MDCGTKPDSPQQLSQARDAGNDFGNACLGIAVACGLSLPLWASLAAVSAFLVR